MGTDTDKIVIYWAPAHGLGHSYDFSHLYPFPKSLFDELSTKKTNPKQNTDDYLRCPAVRHKLKKIFVIRSSTNTKVKITDEQGISYETLSENDNRRHQTTIESIHKPTLENQKLLNYSHPIIFFADSPSLVASLSPPYFHQTTHSAFGAIVPGEFDVSNWFRAMNFEFQLWQGVNELHVPADEPIGYVEFQTERQIELRRFKLTNGLNRLTSSLIHVSPHRRFTKLSEKYKLFKNANISKGILREIQENLMD